MLQKEIFPVFRLTFGLAELLDEMFLVAQPVGGGVLGGDLVEQLVLRLGRLDLRAQGHRVDLDQLDLLRPLVADREERAGVRARTASYENLSFMCYMAYMDAWF